MQGKTYYPALDGLRGIAIILVLLYHIINFVPWFRYGWVGVDLFFVLSGFLITEILLRSKGEKRFIKNFYIRRALRLMPVYYLVVILVLILLPYSDVLRDQYSYYRDHQVFLWVNLQNWMYILYEKPNDHLLLFHCWSLSVEEQFYLLWPLLILIIRRKSTLQWLILFVLAAGIISRFISWRAFGNSDINFLFQSMTRTDGLCIGCLIAIWKFTKPGKWGNLAIWFCSGLIIFHLIVFVLVKSFSLSFPHFNIFGYTSIAALFGLSVYYSLAKPGWFQVVLISPMLRWFGKISYSLYLFHWPVLILFKLFMLDWLEQRTGSINAYIIISLCALAIAIATSWLSYNYFEKNFLRLKERFS